MIDHYGEYILIKLIRDPPSLVMDPLYPVIMAFDARIIFLINKRQIHRQEGATCNFIHIGMLNKDSQRPEDLYACRHCFRSCSVLLVQCVGHGALG